MKCIFMGRYRGMTIKTYFFDTGVCLDRINNSFHEVGREYTNNDGMYELFIPLDRLNLIH
jgi:hypothetical protein